MSEFSDKYGMVAIGYSEDHKFNEDYASMGLSCPYEHCIETCELSEEVTYRSCPVFGHDCPGGLLEMVSCPLEVVRHDLEIRLGKRSRDDSDNEEFV